MSRASVKAKMPIKERGAVRITVAGTRMRTRGHGYGIDCAGMLRAMRATDDVGVLQPVDIWTRGAAVMTSGDAAADAKQGPRLGKTTRRQSWEWRRVRRSVRGI